MIRNFPIRWLRGILKIILQPLGQRRHKPSDKLVHQLASLLTTPNETRRRLSRLTYLENSDVCPLGQLEDAFYKICAVEDLEKRVQVAARKGQLQSLSLIEQIAEAVAQGLLNQEEGACLNAAELARQQVIKVDDFSAEELRRAT